ncbi:MAG TPA: pyridoxamine 5'-phosphate oxidase family protein [Steroidobacteraceae bacterium]|nr:pyridoxamine 5'-phosphate oxidase family protein [Steroidobacteraceae bacterium]
MDPQPLASGEMHRLAQLIERMRVAMLTTAHGSSSLRARPLVTLELDSAGCVWFFVALSSPQAAEIAQQPQVSLSYADSDRQDFVSISGGAEIVRERARMQQLWTGELARWFPRGLDEPDLALLRVRIEQAEYWDAPESPVQRLYGLAKAIATRDSEALGEHQKLEGPAR